LIDVFLNVLNHILFILKFKCKCCWSSSSWWWSSSSWSSSCWK